MCATSLEITHESSVTCNCFYKTCWHAITLKENMADEGKKDMSIVEHEVLEVYEVQDGALQECMMFVKKLSETSLRDLESERSNLNDLLKEAEREVTKLKLSLKTANSNVDQLTTALKVEKEERLKVEDRLRIVKEMEHELKTELRQSKESSSALQKLNQEKNEALVTAEDTVTKLTAEKESLKEELENLQRLRSQDEEETNVIHQRLLKEQEKAFQIEEQRDEMVSQLNKELTELKTNLLFQKEQADAEIAQLRQKLDLEQKMNESLSNEADSCVNDIKRQLVKVTRENTEIQESKETFLERLNTAEEEISTLRKNLNEEKQKREKLYQDNKSDLAATRSQLEKSTSENKLLLSEKDAVEKSLRSLEEEKKELFCRVEGLQESLDATRREVVSLQEELQVSKTKKTIRDEDNQEAADSWANRVEADEDWEQKYRDLEVEYEALQKQFTQVRKHRNRVLRENGGLRRQMSMAGAQLAVTNQKFQRQLQHFRTQLNMAEHLYREKMLECNILEVQLKHLLKSSTKAQQTFEYTNTTEDQVREYMTRSIDFSRRHDFSRQVQRSREDGTRNTRMQHSSKQRAQSMSQAEQDSYCPAQSTQTDLS